MTSSSARRPSMLRLAAGALALATAAVLVPATSAQADPSLSELRQQAKQLRLDLDRLSVEQGLAVERYDAAREALLEATTDQVLTSTDLTDVERDATSARSTSSQRVRAIYMSGGPLGLSATILESTSIADVLSRWKAVETIVRDDDVSQTHAEHAVSTQRATAASAQRARVEKVARRLESDRALAEVQATLTEQRDLLAAADAKVVALAEKQQAAAEAAALARAAASAAQLGISGLGAGSTAQAGLRGLEGSTSNSQTLPDVPAPNATAGAAIAAAQTRLGMPYVWGATGPTSFDCSGLMQWAYRQAGVSIPRTSRQQYAALPKVPLDQLQPGDLVFYATNVANPATIHHVGMYVGEGRSLYAPQTGSNVKIGPVAYGRIIGAARPTAGP